MESLPAFILALWEADAYNETYPNGPKKTVLLTSSDWAALDAYTREGKKPCTEPIAFKPALIKDVKSTTLHF
jgi:hypothetical protein